eukprot:SAG31_NODE_309_length_17949_cov_11.083361_2_plen_60_part_00
MIGDVLGKGVLFSEMEAFVPDTNSCEQTTELLVIKTNHSRLFRMQLGTESEFGPTVVTE